MQLYSEGREGVKWELGFAFFRGWEMGFCALGLGFMKKKNNRKMGMGFQFEQHRLGLWDLSWDLKKTISWEMGFGPPLHDPLSCASGTREVFSNDVDCPSMDGLSHERLRHN